jgi:bisphosphoglycerate-dependent phosphoglycerate mutase
MAKWNVTVMFTGYVEVEVEADSYDEACEEATVIADTDMVHGWDCDIDDCWCEDED